MSPAPAARVAAVAARPWNFGAGPATLPAAVLERARAELADWGGSGMSVMEMSHRSAPFGGIAERAEAGLRELLGIPAHYRVLFLQGGATLQFAMVPLNLLGGAGTAAYVDTGHWSRKAIAEAGRLGEVRVVASSAEAGGDRVPPQSGWRAADDAAYLHYTPNETIGGVEFHWIPESGGPPLVADASSTILSRPLDVSRFGLIYAGAQKNLGIAGLTVVIVREDLLGRARAGTPTLLDYAAHAEARSMLNTPPTWSWYVAGLVIEWLREQGGLRAMGERNRRKAERLYAAIDASGLYRNPVAPDSRSWMNVPFTLRTPELDAAFLAEAGQAGLINLKGHRAAGGMRASLYNAMPEEGVEALVEFMSDFERRRG